MSTSRVPFISLPHEPAHTDKVRLVGAQPDILARSYRLLRQLPPALALAVTWIDAHGRRWVGSEDLLRAGAGWKHVIVALPLLLLWDLHFQFRGEDARSTPRLQFLRRQLETTMLGALTCAIVLFIEGLIFRNLLDTAVLVGFSTRCATYGASLVLSFALLYEISYRLSRKSSYVVVGTRARGLEAFKRLEAHVDRPGKVLGFVDTDCPHSGQLPAAYLGNLDELETVLASNPVDMVYITLPLRSLYFETQQVIWICERLGVNYCCSPHVFKTSMSERMVLRDVPQAVRAAEDVRLLLKRSVDLLASTLLIVLLSPLFLSLAVAIKLTSPGPVFFIQERYGKNRRRFRMYKFRSMVDGAHSLQQSVENSNEVDGPVFKIRRDPRITSLGRWLRMTSLDELPQLLNVLKGEMSLVGPRPMSIRDVQRFTEAKLMRRFSVVPGMTGLWQVSGRSNLSFDRWVQLDMQYIDTWTLGLDLLILLHTVRAVLFCEGAV